MIVVFGLTGMSVQALTGSQTPTGPEAEQRMGAGVKDGRFRGRENLNERLELDHSTVLRATAEAVKFETGANGARRKLERDGWVILLTGFEVYVL
jgi:hypothetical protein